MKRREFLGTTMAGLVALSTQTACSNKLKMGKAQSFQAPNGGIKAVYLQLGHNMWCDYPSALMTDDSLRKEGVAEHQVPDRVLLCQDAIWKKATDRMAEKGLNMLVIDLGEGLFYPSHPELAIEGTWSIEKMREEIGRLNAMGIEVIPKLNFSTTHNGWMGDYTHMVSSKPYYRMCEEVIKDVVEIFGKPRFFHIGMDEESVEMQKYCSQYINCRLNEYWWQDFLHLVRTLEKHDVRPMMWSDYGWHHEDFFDRCPKSVVQQNWYYDEANEGFDPETSKTFAHILNTYEKLEKKGFDQIPSGTNWICGRKKELGVTADDVMPRLVKYCNQVVSKEHLLGYMIASWDSTEEKNEKHILDSIDILAGAIRG